MIQTWRNNKFQLQLEFLTKNLDPGYIRQNVCVRLKNKAASLNRHVVLDTENKKYVDSMDRVIVALLLISG